MLAHLRVRRTKLALLRVAHLKLAKGLRGIQPKQTGGDALCGRGGRGNQRGQSDRAGEQAQNADVLRHGASLSVDESPTAAFSIPIPNMDYKVTGHLIVGWAQRSSPSQQRCEVNMTGQLKMSTGLRLCSL